MHERRRPGGELDLAKSFPNRGAISTRLRRIPPRRGFLAQKTSESARIARKSRVNNHRGHHRFWRDCGRRAIAGPPDSQYSYACNLIIPVRSSLNLGEKSMKKTFAATVAAAALLASTAAGFAADLPVKARPYVPPMIWTWTGFYIGAHVGAGWGTTESTITAASFAPAVAFSVPVSQDSRSGFLGGVQAGYNWQAGWAVFGIQGDIAGADIKGTTPCTIFGI